ncbi:peptide ABC transporter substrate-binding protein [Actinomadura terrae]|uniref:peptide ABC transporter substrate-binding protein n=1 Tax=Actinomadura terrae TaxID=604353 RepID=UPI001FA7A888|nr:peptide ABC transporter substrate-binding protein [Actinomadura terrae]
MTENDDRRADAADVGRAGSLVEGWAEDVTTFNPVLAQDTFSQLAAGLCFEPLVTSDAAGALVPALAEDVPQVEPDGRTYVFTLKDGLRWSDGSPLTSRDVVFTYGLLGEGIGRLEEVSAPDDRHVVLRTTKPHAPFLVTHGQYGILPAHVLGDVAADRLADAPFNALPDVVSGVFAPVRRTAGEEIVFRRNRSFHRGPCRLEEFVYRVFPDGAAVADGLASGEVDVGLIDPFRMAELEAVPALDVVEIDLPTFNFYAHQLDLEKPAGRIFADRAVRRALLLALDREEIVKTAAHGQAVVAGSMMPPTSWAYDPAAKPEYPYDPERAAQLLDASGWRRGAGGVRERDGRPLRFELLAGSNTRVWVDTAEAMRDAWRRLGADVALTLLDFPDLLTRVAERRDFDVCMLAYTWGQDPDQSELFSSAAATDGFNCFGLSDPDVDEVLAAAVATFDRDERVRLYRDYQRLMQELVPAPALFFMKGLYGINRRVSGYRVGTYNQFGARPWMADVSTRQGGGR